MSLPVKKIDIRTTVIVALGAVSLVLILGWGAATVVTEAFTYTPLPAEVIDNIRVADIYSGGMEATRLRLVFELEMGKPLSTRWIYATRLPQVIQDVSDGGAMYAVVIAHETFDRIFRVRTTTVDEIILHTPQNQLEGITFRQNNGL